MDAESSTTTDANKIYGLFLRDPDKQRSTVVKYTKIPDFDFERSARWSPDSYQLQPRLRRIITLEDQILPETTRSMKLDEHVERHASLTAARPIRKIATISESDESDLHPHFGRDVFKKSPKKTSSLSHRAVQSPITKPPSATVRSKTAPSPIKDSAKSAKEVAKANSLRTGSTGSRQSHLQPKTVSLAQSLHTKESVVRSRYLDYQQKDSVSCTPRTSISSKVGKPNESQQSITKQSNGNLRTDKNRCKIMEEVEIEPHRGSKTAVLTVKKKLSSKKELSTIIQVPIDKRSMAAARHRRWSVSPSEVNSGTSSTPGTELSPLPFDTHRKYAVKRKERIKPIQKENHAQYKDCCTQMSILVTDNDSNTDPPPPTLTNNLPIMIIDLDTKCSKPDDLAISNQETLIEPDNRAAFDNLHIPNVSLKQNSLTKDKSDPKLILTSLSLPNLQIPPLDISTHRRSKQGSGKCDGSYIIRRATLTYTTKQKINIQVIGSEPRPDKPPSPLSDYPLSVLSVYKNELNRVSEQNLISNSSHAFKKLSAGNLKSNCSYAFNRNKLVKPSEIISGIRVTSGRLLDGACVSEQFERELNFIDSFFESLQYLESCSLTDKSLDLTQPDKWITNNLELENSEYSHFLTNLEHGALLDDSHTMASKSLCLLNLLIRDEQRRAKNLLFVLKMREDALKDFTKSQILWLENKKKQENTDIPTLKKKQRGALLKLQHECGEMQRMRKALLFLSEKRKSALMKTKKNIELKLTSNVDVERILCSKKKLKRSASAERANVPLKCFELSSSCEDIMLRPSKSTHAAPIASSTSAEKCVQTADSAVEAAQASVSQLTAAAECVVVDGGYLNILFQDLAMPQIFSNGKQYEVNEHALTNIVNSANSANQHDSEVVERFIDQVRSRESSSPSTARSLVEEFDQYYKGLEEHTYSSQEDSCTTAEEECGCAGAGAEAPQGPLPVPAGAAADAEPEPALWSAHSTPCVSAENSLSALEAHSRPAESPEATTEAPASAPAAPATVDCEAERLRQQQIAVEREIKALEQQQLLAVREIPDKPPPPYTPPADARPPRTPRAFAPAELDEDRLRPYLEGNRGGTMEEGGAFELYLKDFCEELCERNKVDQSSQPWEACNLLPRRVGREPAAVVSGAAAELREVLSVVQTTSASGLSTRRSDHIDDILFAEWRRREPEWTALHRDEAAVKNQLFESVFQKVLSDTIQEYQTGVLGLPGAKQTHNKPL